MGLQKKLNRRIIKMTIWSDYVYQIEYEEKFRWWNKEWLNISGSQTQNWISETKKEMDKKEE